MSDRQYQFTHAVDEGCLGWQVNVTMPYVAAYDSAYGKFRETVDKQAAVEKARVELFITAASIVTGSVLMATVASSSLRAVAGNVALDIVCRNNLDKTFDLMSTAYNSQTFMFAVDKVLDTTKDKLTEQVKSTLTELTNTTSRIVAATPLTQLVQLQQFLKQHQLCVYKVSDLIEAAPVADGLKAASYAALRKAPIVNPPPAALDADRLSKKIELCFYMKTILDSDELIDWPASSNLSPYPSTVGVTSHPIPQLPGAPDYPHPAPPKIGYGVTPAYQSIGISRPGSEIRKRVDELYKDIFRKPFYKPGDIFGEVSGPEMEKELVKAKDTLLSLADQTRPMGFSDNKS